MKRIFIFTLINLLLSINLYGATLPPATGKNGMVVSSQHYASLVGLHILKEGGNAIDAAVAMGYALAVVHPCCGNLGGGGFMLVRLANGQTAFIDFREKAPLALHAKRFLNKDGKKIPGIMHHGYLPVGVPGTVMGLNEALKHYGTMTLKQVMTPAILLAKYGFKLDSQAVDFLKWGNKTFAKEANVAKIFLKNGKPYKIGEILKQPQLAKTLTLISKKGTNAFYHGSIAKKIVKASKEHGGVFQLKDFEQYTAPISKPISCHYRNYTIYTSPPPASGTTLCEMLMILNGYPLAKFGYHSAMAIHYSVEAMRYAFADRNEFLGDPAFVHNPVKRLTSPAYAASIRRKIKKNKAGNSSKMGFTSLKNESPQTTHYVVVDRQGNAVSTTVTLDSYFGSKVIAGDTGFFLNNELDDFAVKPGMPNQFGLVQGQANTLKPGKRPLSSMSPTIVTKDGKLFMVIGTPGGATIPTTILQIIQHVIDSKMNIAEAIAAPRYHMQWLPDYIYMEPFVFSPDTAARLKRMGYALHPGWIYHLKYWGAATGIINHQATHELSGASDPRRPGALAIGY